MLALETIWLGSVIETVVLPDRSPSLVSAEIVCDPGLTGSPGRVYVPSALLRTPVTPPKTITPPAGEPSGSETFPVTVP